MAVFGDARRLLKDFAPICGLERQNFVNAALSDVGIALAAKTGVHEQLVDIPQAGKLAVDIIFTLAGTEVAAGDHDLRCLDAQAAVGIIEHQRRFRVADGRTLGRAAEDHVLHLCAAQRLGALFAEYPADRVGNIRFSAAVRADDCRAVAAELQNRLIREGLKALNFQ